MKSGRLFLKWRVWLEKRPIPVLAALSVTLELIIELLGHQDPLQAFAFLFGNPIMFLLNAAIIFLTLTPVVLLRRKVFYSVLIASVWLIFGVVNAALLSVRSTPFSARDFGILTSGIQIVDVYFSPLEIIGLCAATVAFTLLVFLLFTRAPRSEKSRHKKRDVLSVCGMAVILLIFGFLGTRHIKPAVQYESINEAYEACGFPYCFSASIFTSGVSRPEDYSKDRIQTLGNDETVDAEKRPNIIMVQLESFFDPALIRGVRLSEDPIPNFTGLRGSCVSGYLRMPTLGAGTVNAEFEVLTGMSLDFFGIGEYPYESILRESTCESFAFYLKALGYGTHAIHNYSGSFYGRNEVYPNIGFDDFTSVEYMSGIEMTEKEWPKDAVLTKYILQALEQTETPDFVFTVTVQCHGEYPEDNVIDGISLAGNSVFEGDSSEQFVYYAKQLQETDRFLGDLVAALESFDEETVLIAYGDHLPNLGLTAEDLENGTLFQTQYIIWSNYGVGGEDRDLMAFQLTARLMELIGMQGGVITGYHQEHMGDKDYQDGLELLEYDLLYGDRIAYGGVSLYEKTEMKMGLDEITVTDIVFGDDETEITGDGFTEYSIVYVDGKRREDTEFVSPNLLRVPDALSPEDTIEVCQTGRDRAVLSTAVICG